MTKFEPKPHWHNDPAAFYICLTAIAFFSWKLAVIHEKKYGGHIELGDDEFGHGTKIEMVEGSKHYSVEYRVDPDSGEKIWMLKDKLGWSSLYSYPD